MAPQFWSMHKAVLKRNGNTIKEVFIPMARSIVYEFFLLETKWKKKYGKIYSECKTELIPLSEPTLISRTLKNKTNG